MRNLRSLFAMTLGLGLSACGGSGGDGDAAGGSGGAAGAAGAAGMFTGFGGSAGSAGAGAGGSAGSMGGECAPMDVPGFTPEWTPPQPLFQDVCTDSEINAITAACFVGGRTACQAALDDASPECAACAVSAETASEHGATIDYVSRGFLDRNIHGCVAHAENDLTENGCGAKVKAAFDCPIASCSQCLPVTDDRELADLNACAASAAAGPCSDLAAEAMTCTQALPGPMAGTCFAGGGETLTAVLTRYTRMFCGAAPP